MLTLSPTNCRVCLDKCSDADSNITDFVEIYQKLTNFTIHPSDIPSKVCVRCVNSLYQLADFQDRCYKVEILLDEYRLDSLEAKEEGEGDVVRIEIFDSEIETETEEVIAALTEGDDLMSSMVEVLPDLTPKTKARKKTTPRAPKICDICNKVVLKRTMEFHKRIHHRQKPRFLCDLCPRSYKFKRDLKDHLMKIHLKIAQYKCKYCKLKFKDWGGRNYHIKVNHETERVNKECEVCGKRFPDLYRLKMHAVVHTDVREFQCAICSTFFKKFDTLKCHIQVVHLKLEKDQVCSICSKAFKSNKSLKQHMLIHNKRCYTCPVCEHLFTISSTLRIHMAKRHPEFPMPPHGTLLKNIDLRAGIEPDFAKDAEEETLEFLEEDFWVV